MIQSDELKKLKVIANLGWVMIFAGFISVLCGGMIFGYTLGSKDSQLLAVAVTSIFIGVLNGMLGWTLVYNVVKRLLNVDTTRDLKDIEEVEVTEVD